MTFTSTNAALTRKLADLFKACPIEGTIRHEAIAQIAGPRPYLAYRAMAVANAESGAIFVNVRCVGYRRMPHDEAHGLGKQARMRGRRIFHRAGRAIANVLVIANDLSDQARIKAYSEQAALGLLVHMTYDRNRPIITENATPLPTQQSIQAGIEAMRAARQPPPI